MLLCPSSAFKISTLAIVAMALHSGAAATAGAEQTHFGSGLGAGSTPVGGVQLSPERQQIVEDVLKLYQSKPSNELFRHYTKDAIFEDPISYAKGIGTIKSQWFGMTKMFPTSVTENYRVTRNDADAIEFDLNQRYTAAVVHTEKVINSLVVLKLNKDDKITLHQDLWNHRPLKDKGVGFFFRKANANFIGAMIQGPKEE